MKFIITTSPIIDGWTITEYLGPLISNEVLGVNVISDTIASFSDFFGGASGTYRNKLDNLKSKVLNDLKYQAMELNANGIVGFNITFNEISGKGKQMFMATATGTAVKLGHNRLEYARKMHELKTYHAEGILSDTEYEHEVSILTSNVINVVAIETSEYSEKKKAIEIQKKKDEEELKRREEFQLEEEARRKIERQEYEKQYADIIKVIESYFSKRKNDITNLQLGQINSATYDDILPNGNMSHYDIIRYFVALGRADAAGKFYMDKFNLTAEDALQYLLAI